jgi:thymidylate synthase (FAD)
VKYVEPKTFLIGATGILSGLREYLEYSGNEEFLKDIDAAKEKGLSDGEILCSFYAKLCYKSLTLGKNANVSIIRAIAPNLVGCFDSGHGSVFEHCFLNFITTDCSRVFTHELVRHRVGMAFSQTSGRYVALDDISFVVDPLLTVDSECDQKIRELVEKTEETARFLRSRLIKEGDGFAHKKLVTSAIRRIAPNGQANEIGWSINIRQLRHVLVLRTSEHAEWEIRKIFCQVADIIQEKYPLMLYGLERKDTGNGLFSLDPA